MGEDLVSVRLMKELLIILMMSTWARVCVCLCVHVCVRGGQDFFSQAATTQAPFRNSSIQRAEAVNANSVLMKREFGSPAAHSKYDVR